MAKITLSDVSNILGNPTSAANTINANNQIIEDAFEQILSRDGESPNQMTADIDMNHNDIFNVDNVHANVLVLDGVTVIPSEVGALPATVMLKPTYDPQNKNSDAFLSSNHDFLQSGADAVERSVQSKLRDTISVKDFGAVGDGLTDDTTAITNAIAEAVASGRDLYWAAGTYVTTASVASFHSVRHFGPGIVKRGTDTFAVAPKEGQTNILYVAASGGSTSNDGLSSSQALSTLQGAFDALKHYWPLNGKWVIQLAAGTYSSASQRTARLGPANESETSPDDDNYTANGMFMRNMLTIQGPDVGYDPATNPEPDPTAIFDATGAAAVGIQLERQLKLLAKDIKFQNYNGSSSSGGIAADGHCWLRTENVHVNACNIGLAVYNHSQIEVKGGAVEACAVGIRTLFNCKQEIGNQIAGAAGQGPFIRNCTTAGLQVQEGSTGHSDFVTYEDNAVGADVLINSRVNLNGSNFKRNIVAVRAASANVFPSGVVWNTGTADANTENLRIVDSGSIASQNSNSWRTIARSTTTTAVTGSTAVQTVFTATLDAHLYTSVPSSIYRGKAIRYRCMGTISGVAGTKSFQMRVGGTLITGVSLDADNNGSFEVEGTIYLTGNATQKSIIRGVSQIGTNRAKTGYAATTVNTASATDLSFTGTVQLGNAADSITVEVAELEVQG